MIRKSPATSLSFPSQLAASSRLAGLSLLAGAVATGLLVSGCGMMTDITIRHPLMSGAIDKNTIVKEHGFAENARGLPRGTMSDQASLTRLGDQDICFDVIMHELDPIDMRSVRAKLEVQGQVAREQAQLWPEQPITRDYNGLVPVRVQTGYQTYCSARAYNNVCIAWQTRPTYGVVMQPGNVQVFETRARMCFPNGGFVAQTTEAVRLELTVPRPAKSFEGSYTGWGVWGAGDKRTSFAWGLEGALKKK
jgi:hypothetical protein